MSGHQNHSNSLFSGKSFSRIYHYHIRKTGGTSLNYAFFRLSGEDPKQLYARINEHGAVTSGGIRYVGWRRPLIAAGDWDYGFAHAAFHNIGVPDGTYTFTVLRDPAARVLSHYKMLLHMRDHEPQHPGYLKEASWIEAGFDGFLERMDRRELLRQVFMFSREMNVDEALQRLAWVDRVLLLDDQFKADLNALRGEVGLDLEYVHERAAKAEFQPSDDQRARLRELLEPEYRLYDEMTRQLRPALAVTNPTTESVTMNETPRNTPNPADPVESAYRDLWKKKLSDEEWLKNDGRGRVEYAANLLRGALRPEHRVLDIGCGRGTLGIKLGRRDGIFGVDLAPEAVAKAKEVYEDAKVVNIDAEPLPWPDNTFEFVVYLDVIEHVFDPRVGLREIKRVLKPGGKLLLSTPNILAHIDKMRETKRFPKTSGDPEPYDGGHLHFFTYQDIYDLLKFTGFAESQHASPKGNDPNYEFSDKMVWVVGTKGVEPEPGRGTTNEQTNPQESAQPDPTPATTPEKSVNVNTRKAFDVPVAVVAYNRPDHTRQVLESLQDYGVERLYLFADAPKTPEHAETVGQTRELLRSVDWTKVELIERKRNFGLAKSIVAAANHVFAKHDRLLLLEDDIVPFPSLFPFLEAALEKYAANPRVTGISGYGVPQPDAVKQRYPYDAWFFPRISSWGWATWKRAWQRFDPNLPKLVDEAARANLDLTLGGTDLVRNLQHALDGRDIWTMNWMIRSMLDEGVFLYPVESHVRNVGMDGTGLHCGVTDKFNVQPPSRTPDRLPDEIVIDPDLAKTFYSFYDKKGTQRNLNVDTIGPFPVKRLTADNSTAQAENSPTQVNGNGAAIANGTGASTKGNGASASGLDDPNVLIEIAVREMEGGDATSALAKLDIVLEAEGAIPNLNLVRAICLQRLGRIDDALHATRAELAAHVYNRDAQMYEQVLIRQLQTKTETPANSSVDNGFHGYNMAANGKEVAESAPSSKPQDLPRKPAIEVSTPNYLDRCNPDLVVFISDEPRSREAKLAHGLKQAGKQVVLLYKQAPTFDPARFFVESLPYTTPAEAVQLAQTWQPLAFHVFANWNFETAKAVIEAHPGPVLFDDYDVMTGMLQDEVIAWKHPGKPAAERYCLENADGLVARHLELRYLRRTIGFNLPPVLFAVDGCWADPALRAEGKLSSEDGSVHFTTVGNLNPGTPGAKPNEVYVYELAGILAANRQHYHIHPSHSGTYEKTLTGLNQRPFSDQEREFIHLHEPLPPQELVPAISRYDYGLHVLSRNVDLQSERFTARKPEYAAANKLYDFMDAGLRILAHSGRFQQFLIQRYGFGQILPSFAALHSFGVPKPVPEIPESLRVDAIARRLVLFYERIGAGVKPVRGQCKQQPAFVGE
ncbi:methyltransferase domain-containing protein [bacterium]|nr:methyltransferase domain-containing protein [bacterium]